MNIDDIMKIRKGYSLKLYEYFKHIQKKFDEKIIPMTEEYETFYYEEDLIWRKLQEKKTTLDKFEDEIKKLSESTGIIDRKRLLEVISLREKLETKYNETQNEYDIFMSKIEEKQNLWQKKLETLLILGSQRQKIIVQLHDTVSKNLPDLQSYCTTWKNEPILRLNKIIKDAYDIEKFCFSILADIAIITSLNMDQQHLINQKTENIPKNCQELYKKLDAFINNVDYLDIFDKTKTKDSFVEEFLKIFKDNSFTSVRNTIRIVNNVPTTEKKLNIVLENFQQIQLIFQQVLDNLLEKKEELKEACSDAEALALETCRKWLDTHYRAKLNCLEQIKQKRNEFLVNETILPH